MPTYEYVCTNCSQRFDIFLTYSEYSAKKVHCAHCGSADVKRLLSRIRILKSDTRHIEDIADDFGTLEDDPRAFGRMMRKMGNDMGETLPPEFDDVVNRLEAGQSPEEIESAVPGIGESAGEDTP